MRCEYVRVEWERERGRSESRRSFWCCWAESWGREGLADYYIAVSTHWFFL